MKETMYSVNLATEIAEIAAEFGSLSIHVDANVKEECKSSRYVRVLVGMVVGQGFSAVLKPDAWASSRVADKVVKSTTHDHQGRRLADQGEP